MAEDKTTTDERAIYCSCGAQWHGRYVESAAELIALHAERDGLVMLEEFERKWPSKPPRRPRRKRAICPLCGQTTGNLSTMGIGPWSVGEAVAPQGSVDLCVCGHERDAHGNDGVGHCGETACRRGGCKKFKPASKGEAVAPPSQAESTGAQLIAAERERQIMNEGWTDSHDDEHDGGEMTAAACCYGALARRQVDGTIRSKADNIGAPSGWPWELAWWKPSDDPIRNLVKAGALIAAEIDRLQRSPLPLAPRVEPATPEEQREEQK